MVFEVGVLFAFIAMLCWGFGDFLIQRSTRKVGDWETLFVIEAFGVVVLLPFVLNDARAVVHAGSSGVNILLMTGGMLFVASLLFFEALKKGKIAVVEPVFAFEVPVAALLAFGLLGETMTMLQSLLVIAVISGLVLVSLKSHHLSNDAWLERGVLIALLAAIFMGASNFLYGFSSRITNPLLALWFTKVIITSGCFFYMLFSNRLSALVRDIKYNARSLTALCVFDNAAWVAFGYSLSLIPISIAVALSESYIALAVLLGLLINNERLLAHQKLGLIVVFVSAVFLAALTA